MRNLIVWLVAVVAIVQCYSLESSGNQQRYHRQRFEYVDRDFNREDTHGYSSGSKLRSIAQGSAHRAHSAVANQYVAARQAAYVAQNGLAQEAIQAAATASAALSGKEVLLSGLEKQYQDAQSSLEGEIRHFDLAKRAAHIAREAADSAAKHLAVLTAALNDANLSAEYAKASADQAAAELASQMSMVGNAKERLTVTTAKLHAAQIDYKGTREAAQKASAAAEAAQENASTAGAYASQQLHEVGYAKSDEGNNEYPQSAHIVYELADGSLYRGHS